nr:uncharacterized protein LOC112733115 [Arachis hypogaea]
MLANADAATLSIHEVLHLVADQGLPSDGEVKQSAHRDTIDIAGCTRSWSRGYTIAFFSGVHLRIDFEVFSSSEPPPIVVAVCRSERLLPPSVALKNFRLRAIGPLAGSSASFARVSPLSSVLGCSRLPSPVSARAVRVGCLSVSLESRLSHTASISWFVCLVAGGRSNSWGCLLLRRLPWWSPTRRRPLKVQCWLQLSNGNWELVKIITSSGTESVVSH